MRETEWTAAKELAWKARDSGHTLPWNDLLISATAKERGWRVFSRDAHFATLAGLGGAPIYTPGYGGSYQADAEA